MNDALRQRGRSGRIDEQRVIRGLDLTRERVEQRIGHIFAEAPELVFGWISVHHDSPQVWKRGEVQAAPHSALDFRVAREQLRGEVPVPERSLHQQQRDVPMSEDVVALALDRERVHRNGDATHQPHREQRRREVDPVPEIEADARPLADARAHERPSQLPRLGLEASHGDVATGLTQRKAIAMALRHIVEKPAERQPRRVGLKAELPAHASRPLTLPAASRWAARVLHRPWPSPRRSGSPS